MGDNPSVSKCLNFFSLFLFMKICIIYVLFLQERKASETEEGKKNKREQEKGYITRAVAI